MPMPEEYTIPDDLQYEHTGDLFTEDLYYMQLSNNWIAASSNPDNDFVGEQGSCEFYHLAGDAIMMNRVTDELIECC